MYRTLGAVCRSSMGRTEPGFYRKHTMLPIYSNFAMTHPMTRHGRVRNTHKYTPTAQELFGCLKNAVGQLSAALRYELEDRGFDSRWCHWNFSFI
jgi:hypothetical protein